MTWTVSGKYSKKKGDYTISATRHGVGPTGQTNWRFSAYHHDEFLSVSDSAKQARARCDRHAKQQVKTHEQPQRPVG